MDIDYNEARKLNPVFVDVRSEKEFLEGHIPNAKLCSFLADYQRHMVGITYKNEGVSSAVKIGLKLLIDKFDAFISDFPVGDIVVYCARGGLRSEIIADMFNDKKKFISRMRNVGLEDAVFEKKLLALKGKVFRLVGGYKSYRNYVIEKLNKFDYKFRFIVLHGLTCVGKTEMLNELSPSIDLEGLANHRSSLIGGIGKTPVSQKMFESLLFEKLEKFSNERFVFVEGESHKVGNINLPAKFFSRLKEGIAVLVEADIDERVKRFVKEYFDTKEKIEEFMVILPSFAKFIGKKDVDELIAKMKENDLNHVARYLQEEYYDKKYLHAFKDLDFKMKISFKDKQKLFKLVKESH